MMNWWNPLSGLPGAAQQQGQHTLQAAMGGQNSLSGLPGAAQHTLQGQAMGGLNQAAGNLQNQYNAYAQHGQGVAGNAIYPPLSQFEENVPDDELEFEGKLTRWNPYALLAQYSPGLAKKNHFGIECCQRCLMI